MPDPYYPDHLQIAKDALRRSAEQGYGTVELIHHVAAGVLDEATDNRAKVARLRDALDHPDRLVSDVAIPGQSALTAAMYRDAQRVLITYLTILLCRPHHYIRATNPTVMVGQITFCQRCGVIRGQHPLAPNPAPEGAHHG